jgi:tetratricopeptide (TPR) repeat protein
MRTLLIATALLLANLLHAQRPYFLIKAPEKPLAGVKRVAILDFAEENNNYYYDRYDGRGKRTTDAVLQMLMNDKRGISSVATGFLKYADGTTFQKGASTATFSFVERSELQRIIEEQKLGMSGLIDDAQATQVGKILGIDAIVSGSTNWNESHQNGATSRTKRVKAILSLKVISVQTGEILATFSKEHTETTNSNKDVKTGTWTAMKGTNELLDLAFNRVIAMACDYIAPLFEQRDFKFRKVKVKEFADQSKRALDLMDLEDFEGAMTIYKGMVEKDPYTAEALANMGAIYCIYGNFPKAVEFYQMASEIDQAEFKNELDYARKKEAELEVLAAIGVTYPMNELAGNSASALAAKVRTRGGKSDRYDVYNQPDVKASVASKVPGDTEFEILSDSGTFYKIKLLGGKEGFIPKSNVKAL